MSTLQRQDRTGSVMVCSHTTLAFTCTKGDIFLRRDQLRLGRQIWEGWDFHFSRTTTENAFNKECSQREATNLIPLYFNSCANFFSDAVYLILFRTFLKTRGKMLWGSGLPMQCCIIGELNEQPTMAEYGQGASLLPHNQAVLSSRAVLWTLVLATSCLRTNQKLPLQHSC